MKKGKKHNWGKKLMSSILAMTMAAEVIPGMALAVNAAVSEEAVTALTKAYNGDEERARAELEALYQAGIIDEEGKMIEPEIREDGEIVSLDDVAARIANDEETGMLTANGYAVTREKIMQFSEAKGLFDLIRVIREAEDVEITDEHVANYEKLVQNLQDGTIDLESIIMNGGSISTEDLPDSDGEQQADEEQQNEEQLDEEQQEDVKNINLLPQTNLMSAPLSKGTLSDLPSTSVSTGTVNA
ncbi:MAG: hypothetical protein E7496_10645, partial [Ruminococcus sp.]|nr:hypothetical protein [Ruminococcus sp.]